MSKMLNQTNWMNVIFSKFVVGLLLLSAVACNGSNKEHNEQEQTMEKQATNDSISGPISPAETVAKWTVHSIENLQECDLRIEYPNYVFDMQILPEKATFHNPIRVGFVLRRKENKIPLPGQFTLYFGGLHPVEGRDDSGSQWNIEDEDAKKALEIMDNGSFIIRAVNNIDGQIYSFTVGDQTKGATEAYNQLLKLYNSRH